MLNMMTIVLFILAFISLIVAAIAIGWLSILSKHLSALGKRVLESEDIGRVVQVADKAASFESRLTDCESKANEGKDQLAEQGAKISELTNKHATVEQMIDKHAVDLTHASEKIASCELRFGETENNIGDKLNKLMEYETKINELAVKLESVEQKTNKNEAGLTEAERSINAQTSEIEILRKFQAATEKTHNLIQAAFTDIRASTPFEEGLGIASENVQPEENSQGPEDEHQDVESQEISGKYDLEL